MAGTRTVLDNITYYIRTNEQVKGVNNEGHFSANQYGLLGVIWTDHSSLEYKKATDSEENLIILNMLSNLLKLGRNYLQTSETLLVNLLISFVLCCFQIGPTGGWCNET